MELTAKQREVLQFIEKYQKENGYQPHYRNISDHFGWSGPNAVACHIKALQKKGYIKVSKGARRALQIVERSACETIWGDVEIGELVDLR